MEEACHYVYEFVMTAIAIANMASRNVQQLKTAMTIGCWLAILQIGFSKRSSFILKAVTL